MKFLSLKIFLLTAIVSCLSINTFAQTEREQGIELYRKGDYQNALKDLKKAVKKNSADFQSQYYLGLSYIKTRDYKDAAKALQKAVEIDKNNSDAYAALSYSYLLRNDLNNAETNARKTLELDPKSPDGHYILGVSSLRRGSFNYAYERAKKAIELKPDFALPYHLKTEALINSFGMQSGTVVSPVERRYDLLTEAADSLEKYVSLAPNDGQIVFLREYLASLKFFADYYGKPENRKPISFDADESQNNGATALKILSRPKPQYTDDARQANVSGNVKVLVVFGADGNVPHVLVIKTLGYGLDEEAVESCKQIKFEPAMKDGKPVSVVKTVIYNFAIYDRIVM